MIARRLSSSEIDPHSYFIRKHQQDAKGRREFFDIHEGGMDPASYDVLIPDISHETLRTTNAEELGVSYLSKAADSDANEVVEVGTGIIHGDTLRPIVPSVVSRSDEARWAFSIVDSSSPFTYLSVQVSAVSTCFNKNARLAGF